MRKDPKILLEDMLDSINRIHKMTAGMLFNEFKEDTIKQDAVIRRLSVIGEAASKMPDNIVQKHSEVSWREIIDMRNFIVHKYFEIDMEIIWKAVTEDLPKLKADITKILKELG